MHKKESAKNGGKTKNNDFLKDLETLLNFDDASDDV